jgi:hypothetical protein
VSGTDIAADSFSAKPKTFWRASNLYCRIDEEPDPERGIHGRMVINEPDAWLVNLADNSAKHLLDRGPTFNFRLHIRPRYLLWDDGVPFRADLFAKPSRGKDPGDKIINNLGAPVSVF